MTKDFRFFLSLQVQQTAHVNSASELEIQLLCTAYFSPPSVNHLVTFLEPADPRHLTPRSGPVHVDDQVIFGHKHLQAAHHIAAGRTR